MGVPLFLLPGDAARRTIARRGAVTGPGLAQIRAAGAVLPAADRIEGRGAGVDVRGVQQRGLAVAGKRDRPGDDGRGHAGAAVRAPTRVLREVAVVHGDAWVGIGERRDVVGGAFRAPGVVLPRGLRNICAATAPGARPHRLGPAARTAVAGQGRSADGDDMRGRRGPRGARARITRTEDERYADGVARVVLAAALGEAIAVADDAGAVR